MYMRLNVVLTFVFLMLILIQIKAHAYVATVSNITGENIICFNTAKSDALVFKTSDTQKIWKATHDKEGKLKVKNALQLGKTQLIFSTDGNYLKDFKADLTENYHLSGSFEAETDGDFSLKVTKTEGDKGESFDYYNCQPVKN
jgi:hypothetical protein